MYKRQALFCDWIDEAWNGGKNYLWLAAAAAPKEFIAAAYLYGLYLRRQGVTGKSMVTLDTRQVVLKPLTIRDLNRVHQLASDPEVAKNMRFSVHKSLEEMCIRDSGGQLHQYHAQNPRQALLPGGFQLRPHESPNPGADG